ncbi:MAG: chloride channel protein [Candidatus Delongbacteria bacterium]|nr:chloride channel protein [Candidatus Delongbacteria bacterium]MBN2834122.1 chloride channel protein [Candidatus Delongbacteria bacterium]
MKRIVSYTAESILHRFGEKGLLVTISVIIGLICAILAVLLKESVHYGYEFVKELLDMPMGFLIPGIGALLSVIFLRYFVKDFMGHGIPDVLLSIVKKGGLLKGWDTFSRMVSSFFTVSAGGSAGLEGPIVFTGSAVGSNIATFFNLRENHRIILIGAGTAAAISAIFNAPLTGMVFALEVMLSEWTARTIIPTAIASIVATESSRLMVGNFIAFESPFASMHTTDLIAASVLGVITGLISVAFIRGLDVGEHFFQRFFKNPLLRAFIGGTIVGLLFLIVPKSLGDGHSVVKEIISGFSEEGIWVVLLLVIFKFFASISTLSSGGSGGIFAPGLFLGASVGLFFGRLINSLPPFLRFSSPESYALVGMAGLIAGILQAPLTGMFLVLEITNGYNFILPLILVSVISMIVSNIFEDGSIYTRHLIEENILERTGSDGRILSELDISEILETDCQVVDESTMLRDFIDVIKGSKRNQFIVTEQRTGKYIGIIFIHEVRQILFETDLYNIITVTELIKTGITPVKTGSSLKEIIDQFEQSNAFTLPVVDKESERYIGLISKATLFTKYRQELLVQSVKD